jgi:hypothetical protein
VYPLYSFQFLGSTGATLNPDSEPAPAPKKNETFAVEVPEGTQKQLEEFLKTVGGRICF